jgi:hypothetical protein
MNWYTVSPSSFVYPSWPDISLLVRIPAASEDRLTADVDPTSPLTILLINLGKSKIIFKLNNIAYIPEFYINLILASKVKVAGIYYNTRTNCLE